MVLSVVYEGLSAVYRIGRRQRRQIAEVPRRQRARQEYDRGLHERSGFLSWRARLVRQAIYVRRIAANAASCAVAGGDKAGQRREGADCFEHRLRANILAGGRRERAKGN